MDYSRFICLDIYLGPFSCVPDTALNLRDTAMYKATNPCAHRTCILFGNFGNSDRFFNKNLSYRNSKPMILHKMFSIKPDDEN